MGFVVVKRFNLGAFTQAGLASFFVFATFPAMGAPEDVLRPYALVRFERDSNVFRLANDNVAEQLLGSPDRSDRWRRLEAGIIAAIPVSQQQFEGRLSIGRTTFNRFSGLDNTSHEFDAGWKWRLGDLFYGKFRYDEARSLSSFVQTQSNVRNLRTERRAAFDLNFLVDPRWRMRAGLSRFGLSNGTATQRALDTVQYTWDAGLDYVSRADNVVGAQLRVIDGQYPQRTAVSDGQANPDFRQAELGLSAKWALTADTQVDGALGYTRRTHSETVVRDFKGPTGRVNVSWRVTAVTTVAASTWHTISINQDLTSSYLVGKGFNGSVTWAPISRLTFSGELRDERFRYEGDPNFSSATVDLRADRVRSRHLKVAFMPLPQFELGLSVVGEHRASNVKDRGYRSDSYMATARFEF